MAGQGPRSPGKIESAEQRRERLAAELRANLMKRKTQAKARAGQPAPGQGTPGRTDPEPATRLTNADGGEDGGNGRGD